MCTFFFTFLSDLWNYSRLSINWLKNVLKKCVFLHLSKSTSPDLSFLSYELVFKLLFELGFQAVINQFLYQILNKPSHLINRSLIDRICACNLLLINACKECLHIIFKVYLKLLVFVSKQKPLVLFIMSNNFSNSLRFIKF